MILHNLLRRATRSTLTILGIAIGVAAVVALGAMDYIAVATPDTLERHCPGGFSAHNFRDLPFIAFNRKTGCTGHHRCERLRAAHAAKTAG